MTLMVERGYKDYKEGKAPDMGRQAGGSDEERLDAPHAVPKEDFASRSPAKRRLIRYGRPRRQHRLTGTYPAAANLDIDRFWVDKAGGRDDGGLDGSDDDNALGNHGTGSGRETANPGRHSNGDVTTYEEDGK